MNRSTKTRIVRFGALAGVLVVLLVGGGWGFNHYVYPATPEVTMNAIQAKTKAQGLLDDAISAVQPGVSWQDEAVAAELHYMPLSSHYDGTADVVVTRELAIRVSVPKLSVLVHLVGKHWQQQGYKVTFMKSADGAEAAEAFTPDGNRVSVNMLRAGAVTVGTTVGTFQGPASPLDGDRVFGPPHQLQTDAQGNAVFLPLKDDPYWSH